MVSRRDFVAGGIGAVLSGGVAGYVGHKRGFEAGEEKGESEANDYWRQQVRRWGSPDAQDKQIKNAEFNGEIDVGEYRDFVVEGEYNITFLISFAADTHMDLIGIHQDEWSKYENDEDTIRYRQRLSQFDASQTGFRSTAFGGKYHIVLDNTDHGEASPTEPVEVAFSMEAYTFPDEINGL